MAVSGLTGKPFLAIIGHMQNSYATRHQYESEQYAREARIAREAGDQQRAEHMDRHAEAESNAAERSRQTGWW